MKRNSCARLPCLAAMIAVALATIPVRAGGMEPGELRVLTLFDDTANTSTCIGRPTTPLCAAETVEAYVNRRDDHIDRC